MQEQQPEGVPVDPVMAFETFQQYHGMEMGRIGGELVRVNTFCRQLQQELVAAHERITALEQNQTEPETNGARKGGADMAKMESVPKAPASLSRRMVKDDPQA